MVYCLERGNALLSRNRRARRRSLRVKIARVICLVFLVPRNINRTLRNFSFLPVRALLRARKRIRSPRFDEFSRVWLVLWVFGRGRLCRKTRRIVILNWCVNWVRFDLYMGLIVVIISYAYKSYHCGEKLAIDGQHQT